LVCGGDLPRFWSRGAVIDRDLLGELTTNTLKHAVDDRAGVHIEVRIAQKDGMITLTYRNDGPDYPEDVLNLKRYSAGLDIVKQSVHKSLQGDLSLHNADGAVAEIRFKPRGKE